MYHMLLSADLVLREREREGEREGERDRDRDRVRESVCVRERGRILLSADPILRERERGERQREGETVEFSLSKLHALHSLMPSFFLCSHQPAMGPSRRQGC